MELLLDTIFVWRFDKSPEPGAFFEGVPLLCQGNEILVIGAYNPAPHARLWLEDHMMEIPEPAPFSDSFELNRDEYPMGRCYPLLATVTHLKGLCSLAGRLDGSMDKALFFDHILMYRVGNPLLPLMNFHDAFSGGALEISGFYSEEVVREFARSLGIGLKRVLNPMVRIVLENQRNFERSG